MSFGQYFVGIDPGVSGGLAAIGPGGDLMIIDRWHGTPAGCAAAIGMALSASYPFSPVVIVEHVWASPQMGRSSAFTFGSMFGAILAALECYGATPVLVTPQKWQGALDCRTGGDKHITLDLARRLYPDIGITLRTADAVLLARYGHLHHNTPRSESNGEEGKGRQTGQQGNGPAEAAGTTRRRRRPRP